MIEKDAAFLKLITELGISKDQIIYLFHKATMDIDWYEAFYKNGGRFYIHLNTEERLIGVISNVETLSKDAIYARLDRISKLIMH